MQLWGGKGGEGLQEVKGLALDGASWPCRRGDSRPSQAVQVAGAPVAAESWRFKRPETLRCRENRNTDAFFSASPCLCGEF